MNDEIVILALPTNNIENDLPTAYCKRGWMTTEIRTTTGRVNTSPNAVSCDNHSILLALKASRKVDVAKNIRYDYSHRHARVQK